MCWNLSRLGINAEVEYLNTDGETCKLNAVIRDVYARRR